MHELSVCLALVDQVQGIAGQHGATRVERIFLRIGPLSGLEPELLRNAFPFAAAGSLAEGAELSIEPAPVRVYCSRCGAETEVPPNRLLCGRCGDFATRLVSGDEMLLERLQLTSDERGGVPDGAAAGRGDVGAGSC